MARSVLAPAPAAAPPDRVPEPARARDFGELGRAAHRVRPVSLAGERLLPVLPALEGLFPERSLKRGTTIAVAQRVGVSGATTLAFALASAASTAGSWVAVVAIPGLGLAAAAAAGVALERLAVVPEVPTRSWSSVVAALVDAFDVVMVAPDHRPAAADVRRLRARTRERGAVLVELGADAGAVAGRARLDADTRLTVTASTWVGLGHGHGHLDTRRVVVEAEGRGAAAMIRQVELWLPDARGDVVVAGKEVLHAGSHARGVVS